MPQAQAEGAKASKNLNANLNEKLTNNNENLINPNLSENKNSRFWIIPGAAIGLSQTAAMQDVTPKVVRIAVRMATIV